MQSISQPFWRGAPFIRLLLPLTAGIVTAQYTAIPFSISCACAGMMIVLLTAFRWLPKVTAWRWRWLRGCMLQLLLAATGCLLMYARDSTHHPKWFGKYAEETAALRLSLCEPPVEKPRSWKSLARVEARLANGRWETTRGKLLVYFKKDSPALSLRQGAVLVVTKPPQRIASTANPGGFDYRRYCAFQDVSHQLYLQPGDYLLTGESHASAVAQWLTAARHNVLSTLRQWIPGAAEAGVAEALLIGYRDDLDKDLVRAYSVTGVVHIIAISGLHLGMIYGLMLLLLRPFRRRRWIRWVKPIVILLVLWGFSLLAGSAASILRSVVMFSFIVAGESIGRKTNVYNTLAASAFCLLVYDPYFLWDVGFQLSYAAVLSIVLFMKPIYHLLYCRNKLLDMLWELNAITLAAQVLTLPLLLFYFHQFPNLFLFTNFVAVPLSGFVLYGELALLIVHPVPVLNGWTGQSVSFLIRQLNGLIERTGRLPFAVADRIPFDLAQTVLLYVFIACLVAWLFGARTRALLWALGCMACFAGYGAFIALERGRQEKIVVYHVPNRSAIDHIVGRHCFFTGDAALFVSNAYARQQLDPTRIAFGVTARAEQPVPAACIIRGTKHTALLVGRDFRPAQTAAKMQVDLIVLTQGATIHITELARVFDCNRYVFDSGNPLWKIRFWKKEADSLHLRHHTVPEQGAFETDL